jgi:hypothetical protein
MLELVAYINTSGRPSRRVATFTNGGILRISVQFRTESVQVRTRPYKSVHVRFMVFSYIYLID